MEDDYDYDDNLNDQDEFDDAIDYDDCSDTSNGPTECLDYDEPIDNYNESDDEIVEVADSEHDSDDECLNNQDQSDNEGSLQSECSDITDDQIDVSNHDDSSTQEEESENDMVSVISSSETEDDEPYEENVIEDTESSDDDSDMNPVQHVRIVIPTSHISNGATLNNSHQESSTSIPNETDRLLCKICMDCEVGIVFQPCGHLMACVNCSSNITICPLCRGAIIGIVRAYPS